MMRFQCPGVVVARPDDPAEESQRFGTHVGEVTRNLPNLGGPAYALR